MTVLYGIRNCDTVKKARRWLDKHGIAYRFHDFRGDGLSEKQLARWVKRVGWDALLNRRGTTWRKLSPSQREGVDQSRALALMREYPALIKRPVLETDGALQVGFSEQDYAALWEK